jgi:hypothetical protein
MPLAKFVGAYTDEAMSINVDMHQRKTLTTAVPRTEMEPVFSLYMKAPMLSQTIALIPVGGNRFRSAGLSEVMFVEFEVTGGRVSGLTLEQGKGKPPVRLRWNP